MIKEEMVDNRINPLKERKLPKFWELLNYGVEREKKKDSWQLQKKYFSLRSYVDLFSFRCDGHGPPS